MPHMDFTNIYAGGQPLPASLTNLNIYPIGHNIQNKILLCLMAIHWVL